VGNVGEFGSPRGVVVGVVGGDLAGPGEVENGRECVDLGGFVDGDSFVVWGGENFGGGFGGGEVDHSSPVGDLWLERVGALGEGEVDEVHGGGPKQDVGGLEVRMTPSQKRAAVPAGGRCQEQCGECACAERVSCRRAERG
jgi:hypothetical protein